MDEALIQEQERQLQKDRPVLQARFLAVCRCCAWPGYFYGARPLLLCGIALLTGNLCDRLVALLRHRVYTNKDLSNELQPDHRPAHARHRGHLCAGGGSAGGRE